MRVSIFSEPKIYRWLGNSDARVQPPACDMCGPAGRSDSGGSRARALPPQQVRCVVECFIKHNGSNKKLTAKLNGGDGCWDARNVQVVVPYSVPRFRRAGCRN